MTMSMVGTHIQGSIKGMVTCCGIFGYEQMHWHIELIDGRPTFVWKCPACEQAVCREALEMVEVAG